MAQYGAKIAEVLDDYRMVPERFIDAGDDRVLVFSREGGRGKGSGAEVQTHLTAHLWTLKDGKAVRMQSYLGEGGSPRSRGHVGARRSRRLLSFSGGSPGRAPRTYVAHAGGLPLRWSLSGRLRSVPGALHPQSFHLKIRATTVALALLMAFGLGWPAPDRAAAAELGKIETAIQEPAFFNSACATTLSRTPGAPGRPGSRSTSSGT